MTSTETSEFGYDVSECEREAIRTPGAIQPHGYLIATDGATPFTVRRVSRNVSAWLGRDLGDLIGRPLGSLLGAPAVARLRPTLEAVADGESPRAAGPVVRDAGETSGTFETLAHRSGRLLILEFEPEDGEAGHPAPDPYSRLSRFLARLDIGATLDDLNALAAAEVRRLTGFDRVLVYRFDEDGHGSVIAEDRNDRLPSYLGLRFPATDIPRQARELYALNRVRLIPDAGYEPVPLVPPAPSPLDLSFSTLRSVSPFHVEYMRNMGTAASMSVSVVRDGVLWGLIACHNRTPRRVPFGARAACELLSQIYALQLANKEHQVDYERRFRLTAAQSRLIASLIGRDDFVAGLSEHADDLMRFAGAGGAAVLFEGHCTRFGRTPDEASVRKLAEWLSTDVRHDVFATPCLSDHLPWASAVADTASGALAVSISKLHKNFLIWFRPEVETTVRWAGDPGAAAGGDPHTGRVNPRESFAARSQLVRLRSAPWLRGEVEGASELRNAIVGLVLRKAEELAALNAELARSNEELEAFSYSVSHDLRAPFRHIVGYAELLRELAGEGLSGTSARYVETIIESAQYAGTLVDNLLAFSRMGRTTIAPVGLDMNVLVAETVARLGRDAQGRQVTWKVNALPPARGDLMMMRLALENLLSNALKYTRKRDKAVIEVRGEARGDELVYSVRDNGVGFDMGYADKLFGVFQRLHRMEDFEGTGIGLANVRRIMARHGGRVWAEGAVGEGATFSFALPRGSETESVRGEVC